MEGASINHLNFNYKHILFDEIALEGLEGIGLKLLWKRLAFRLKNDITEKLRKRLWSLIIACANVELYELPEPAPCFEIKDRFEHANEDTGYVMEPETCLDGPYEFNLIPTEMGSSKYYNTRKLISKTELSLMMYEEVFVKYGETMVIVASIDERWHALAPNVSKYALQYLKPLNYAMLELIGKARENGQMTVGNTNLLKITNDPKILFYHRKRLEELKLIKGTDIMQSDSSRSFKSILLRLSRFDTPKVLTIAKGKLSRLRDHLIQQPCNRDNKHSLRIKNLISSSSCKMVGNKVSYFQYDMNEDMKEGGKVHKKNIVKLISDDEESESSDEEPPLKCQQKICVNLYRQAYDAILESGLNGLTQIELGQLLSISFYASRTIIRSFTNRKLIRIFTIDQGKQKTCKYVLRTVSGDSVKVYADAKQKLLEYFNKIERTEEPMEVDDNPTKRKSVHQADEDESNKKAKLEAEQSESEPINISELKLRIRGNSNITIKKSLKDPRRSPSLRLLQILNTVLKIIGEHEVIETNATLNHMVRKEIGPPFVESDAFKRYLSKLAQDRLVNIYKLTWPHVSERSTILICASHVKKDHPKILEIYKRISAVASKKHKEMQSKKDIGIKNKMFSQTYSRFLKIQKLHEFVFNLVYLNPDNVVFEDKHLPEGFVSLGTILLEMPLELAVGHLSVKKLYDLNRLDLTEIEPRIKLKEAPKHISQTILYSNSFIIAFKTSVEILASIGLLQVCFQTELITNCLADKNNQILYINRQAKLIDTRGQWPPPGNTPPDPHKIYTYSFENLDSVNKYWNQVVDISLGTTVTVANRKKKINPQIPVRSIKEVQNYDNGDVLGDGYGPAGFHSLIHTDIIQLWQPFKLLAWKLNAVKQKVKPTAPKPKKKKIHIVKKVAKIKKKTPIPKKERSGIVPRQRHPRIKKENKCVWSKHQDDILLWSKVAMTIMSPLQMAGSIQVTNLVAKDLINISDNAKTVAQCYKRAKILDQKPSFTLRLQHLVNQLRSHTGILGRYEGLLKKLRSKYMSNLNKFISEARVKCLELVSIVQQLFLGNILCQRIPAVALSYDEFHEKFIITYKSPHKCLSLYATPDECSTDVSTIKEGIIIVLCIEFTANLSTTMATKIYNTFSQYPERSLRIATEQLHKSGAVSIRDKFINLQFQKASYSDIIQYASGYKISTFYQRRWQHRLNNTFLDNAYAILESSEATNSIKPSSEMSCFLNELQALDAINIMTTGTPNLPQHAAIEPFSLTELDIKNKFKSGSVGWVNKSNVRFMKDLYNNIDYGAAVKELIVNATVKISEVIYPEDDLILNILQSAGGVGKTFKQLQELTSHDAKHLQNLLIEYEKKLIIKRVGYFENYVVLTKYVKDWCLKIDDCNFIPSPWYHLDLQIMYPIFIDWCATILNYVFQNPGSTVTTISESLTYITPRSVQEICMFLQNCECIIVRTLLVKNIGLFSDDDDDVVEYIPFNQYESPEVLVVFPIKDTIMKFVNLRHEVEQYCKPL